jgi:hypothetical protein
MYTYYFVSMHNGKDGEAVVIPWKSALTVCQMVQFVLMNAQALYLIFYEKIYDKACNQFPV